LRGKDEEGWDDVKADNARMRPPLACLLRRRLFATFLCCGATNNLEKCLKPEQPRVFRFSIVFLATSFLPKPFTKNLHPSHDTHHMPSYRSINKITDAALRERVVERTLRLRAQLNAQVPQKSATETLLLATWNIREFGNNRSAESLQYIAEIINRFDLVAVQEVAGDLSGLEALVKLLGHNWDYIVTDSTEGTAGGSERTAFIFDKCKVFFRKVAGEIVLPKEKLLQSESGDGVQFARTPFCVAFQAGWFKFNLTTVHIYYGESKAVDPLRLKEISTIAEFLSKRADKEETNYILLGDFNIFTTNDETFAALEKKKFYVPDALRTAPSNLTKTKHFDQIAFRLKLDSDMTVFSKEKQNAGAFDFSESVYRDDDTEIYKPLFPEKNVAGKTEKQIQTYYKQWRTYQMSDHLPLWVELKIDFSDAYLTRILKTK
jgi:endonuclease/exonuclease/phosphatase family metal-dependent hydrolase